MNTRLLMVEYLNGILPPEYYIAKTDNCLTIIHRNSLNSSLYIEICDTNLTIYNLTTDQATINTNIDVIDPNSLTQLHQIIEKYVTTYD